MSAFSGSSSRATSPSSLSSVTMEVHHSVAGSGIWGTVELEAAGTAELLEAILMNALIFVLMQRLDNAWREFRRGLKTVAMAKADDLSKKVEWQHEEKSAVEDLESAPLNKATSGAQP